MLRIARRLLDLAFSPGYKLNSGSNGEIQVENLQLNPEANVFRFLRRLPVQITKGTARMVTITGVSFVGALRDAWTAYKSNKIDHVVSIFVSDLSSTATARVS